MASADETETLRHAAMACILEGMEEAGLGSIPPQVVVASAAASHTAETAGLGLNERVEACRLCSLGSARQCSVPGEGPSTARIMILGSAPGEAEDLQGRPFLGPAGQLLDKIIQGGMGLKREEVFLSNTLKCRPAEDRAALTTELDACAPYLEEQIAAVQPELLIALGQEAAQHLLKTDLSLSRLRGELHHRPQGGPMVLVTYHPAYLLQYPEQKRACWEDIQLGLRYLGLGPSAS
ncbi:MAG: uracil-DNA glycosylase [Planctomycetota bacterium]|nr:uracil-DNA glycosylase [Planctomycetota bacterium]MDA1114429.1 uracil-DNA glycosylase [Planctomycetota bacterium]